jgi:hypothetical protein
VALALSANAARRLGIGGQKEESETFNWRWSLEYLYGESLHTNVTGSARLHWARAAMRSARSSIRSRRRRVGPPDLSPVSGVPPTRSPEC